MLRLIVIFACVFFLKNSSFSKNEYFLTLRNEKVNLRQGPSFEYPVKIFYRKKFLPVLVKDEHGNFKKIKEGWNYNYYYNTKKIKED